MISLHLSEIAGAIGPKIGPSVLLAMASGVAVIDEPVAGSPFLMLAALAGSAGAELFRFINREEPSLDRFWREALKTAGIIVLGFFFGWLVGPTFAGWISAERVAGGFLMGLCGYGIMRVLLSPDFILRIAQKLVEGARHD